MLIKMETGASGDNSVDVTQYVANQNPSVAQGASLSVNVTQKPRLAIAYYLLSGSAYFRCDIWDTSTDNILTIQKPAATNTISFANVTNSSLDEFTLTDTTLSAKNSASGTRIMGIVAIY